MNRVSKVVVQDVLDKYLDRSLVWKILEDIEAEDLKKQKSMCGMLYGEWKKHFDDEHSVVWAADSGAGFGRKGWTVYGDCDDMQIVQVDRCHDGLTLHLWYGGRNDWR